MGEEQLEGGEGWLMGLRTKKEDRSQELGMGEGSQAGGPPSPSSARWKHRVRVSRTGVAGLCDPRQATPRP